MTVDLELAGARHVVDVRRDGDRWLVTVDGRARTASVSEIGGRWSLLIEPLSASARAQLRRDGPHAPAKVGAGFEIAFEPRGGGVLIVHVNGQAVPVTIPDARRRRRDSGVDGATAPTPVVAPMPGRIVKVLVTPGEMVEARQPLVVVEAMKMENELRAPRAGSVSDMRISQGMSVEANAVLMVIS